MKIVKKSDEKLVFEEEISESLANAIRRSSLEIPIPAIDEVEFHKNDSVLYDEILALRLGLIPIKNQTIKVSKDKCSCEGKGCAKCGVQLKLSAKGPGMIYARDFKGKAEAVFGDTPIVYLDEGQELEFVATAQFGEGVEHTKFSPGIIYYSLTPEVQKIDKKDVGNKIVSNVDEKELKQIKEGLGKAFDFIGEVVKNKDEYLFVKPGKEILFSIESWGQIKATEILEESVKALKENLKQIK